MTAHVPLAEANSLDRLVQENLGPIYALIYAKVGNREEAEELTSRVFMTAWRNRAGQTPESMHGFLVRVARAVVADYWRAFAQTDPAHDATAPPIDADALDAVAAPLSAAQRIERLGGLLPPLEHAVLTSRLLLNRSTAETAKQMRMSEAEVTALLYRALWKASELDPSA